MLAHPIRAQFHRIGDPVLLDPKGGVCDAAANIVQVFHNQEVRQGVVCKVLLCENQHAVRYKVDK